MIIAKFGGTSMLDAKAMLTSAGVILKNPETSLVVVSATSGTTDFLIDMAHTATHSSWDVLNTKLQKLRDRHMQISKDLAGDVSLNQSLDELFLEVKTLVEGMYLLKESSKRSMDSLLSIGERLSSLLFTKALNNVLKSKKIAQTFDAREVLITDDQFGKAEPILEDIKKYCQQKIIPLISHNILVTQGFIGRTKDGVTTTLGRGGSDYSAALLAEGLEAKILHIWTDVAGIATTDPRITPKARPIAEISFNEAAELASFGAKILHPTTLWPAIRQNIPVFVGSSQESHLGGTWIRSSCDSKPKVRAIAVRRRQKLLTLSTVRMLNAYGFLAKVFTILGNHKISIDLVATSEISISVTIDQNVELKKELMQELESVAQVTVEDDLSLIALIGNHLFYTPGIAAKTFEAMNNINIRLICQGASDHNMCFLINGSDDNEAVKRLHRSFLE